MVEVGVCMVEVGVCMVEVGVCTVEVGVYTVFYVVYCNMSFKYLKKLQATYLSHRVPQYSDT